MLECIIDDYLTFIVLLFGLFCVAGNITPGRRSGRFSKDQCGTSAFGNHAFQLGRNYRCQYVNGASGDQDERLRKEEATLWCFFIFLISNIGGCLTPIGDPPCYGLYAWSSVFWSLHLLPYPVFNVVVLVDCILFPGPKGLQKGHCRRKKTRHQQTRYRGTYPGTSQSDLSGYDRCCRYLKRNFTGNGSI